MSHLTIPPLSLKFHRQVESAEWWETAWQDVRIEPWHMTRVGCGGATHLYPVFKIPDWCQDHLGEKIYLTYGIYRHGGGQNACDLEIALQYVIDLDTDEVATDAQFTIVSEMFPQALLLRTNGVQIFLEPSGKGWEHDCYLLRAMGREAARRSGLKYDDHHVTKCGRPTRHQNHNYRSPWGWASRREMPVKCFLPKAGRQLNVQETADSLRMNVPIPGLLFDFEPVSRAVAQVHLKRHRLHGSISQADKVEECRSFMKARFDLLRTGIPIEEAEEQVCSQAWGRYTSEQIRDCFKRWPSIYRPPTGSGAGVLDNSEDQKLYTGFLGLISRKRRRMQRSFGLFAHRAWCVEFFYSMDFTPEEVVRAFLNWPECAPLRRMSVDAIGLEEVRRDIERCVQKFGDGAGAQPADPKLVAAVLKAAEKAGTFRARELLKVVDVRSLRHLQTILKMLMDRGELRKVGGSKNTQWQLVRAAHIGIDKTTSLPVSNEPTPAEPEAVSSRKLEEEAAIYDERIAFFQLGTQPPPHLSQMAPYRPLATPEQLSRMSRLERMAYATRRILPNPYNLTPRQRACVSYEKELRSRGGYSEKEMAALITLLRWTGRRHHNRAVAGLANINRLC